MKLDRLWRFQIPTLISNYTVLKCHLSQSVWGSSRSRQTKKTSGQKITKERIQNLDNVMSIAVAYNYVSWAKISIPGLVLLNWDSYILPDIQKGVDENVILESAHDVISNLPTSDFYVLESQSSSWRRNFSDSSLACMLSALLSLQDKTNSGNIFFQNPHILNKLHNLLVGGERINMTGVVKKKVEISSRRDESIKQDNNDNSCYSLINIHPEQLECFRSYEKVKQGGLSLALLLAVTFIDTEIIQTPETFQIKKQLVNYH